MNNINKKTIPLIDRKLFIFTVLLVVFGFVMVTSASTSIWVQYGPNAFTLAIVKNIIFLIVGIFGMALIQKRFNWTWIEKNIEVIGYTSIVLMFLSLFFTPVNGARAWITIPGIGVGIQPVEFLKLSMILFLSIHFDKNAGNDKPAKVILRLPLIFTVVTFLFILVGQNDLGSGLIVVMIVLMMIMSLPDKKFLRTKIKIGLSIILLILLIYIFGKSISNFIFSLPTDFPKKIQLLRIAVLFDPLRDKYDLGFQVTNSLAAIVEGNIFGVGLGNSATKMIIPEPTNDAIIAVIAEELGVFGIGFLFMLYTLIVNRLLAFAQINSMQLRDRLVLVGIASLFVSQFFVNIGGMSGLIPMTGVTLLFVSSGGSSLLSAFFAIGLAQGVIKRYKK